MQCVFPFTYGGEQYFECTTGGGFTGVLYCATIANLPADDNTNWGYCDLYRKCGKLKRKCRHFDETLSLATPAVVSLTTLGTGDEHFKMTFVFENDNFVATRVENCANMTFPFQWDGCMAWALSSDHQSGWSLIRGGLARRVELRWFMTIMRLIGLKKTPFKWQK